MIGFEQIRDRVSLASPNKVRAMHRLLAEGEIGIAFQPIWNLESNVPLGYEALARLAPRYGFTGPAEAFDLALQAGRVHQLDQLCVRKAFARAHELDADTLLFVNVTPYTLDIDAGSDNWLAKAANQAGLAPERIVIEVTERPSVRSSGLMKALAQLRKDGFKLALDDAGTGSSGLEMLGNIHFEFVKIDRSVVTAAVTENRARGILLALASYARQTGALVIAEGIENQETLSFVQTAAEGHLRAGIQGGQGYLLGRPADTLSDFPLQYAAAS